jgi:thiamine pyrophosphate-dependent acetolactate synthase large subunit-like protein
VFDNGKLGFVEIKQRAEGLLDTFTKLKNPNFGDVARALGLWGQTVSTADQLESAVKVWLSQSGPALLHMHVNPMQPSCRLFRPLNRRSEWRSTRPMRFCMVIEATFGKW